LKIALDIAEEADNNKQQAKIVVILPDSGSPYLSKLYNDSWLEKNGFDINKWE